MPVGLLHPGEMGGGLAGTWGAGGQAVVWASEGRSAATRRRAEQAGATDLGTVAGVAAAADLVISVCPPQFALDVAGQVAATGFGLGAGPGGNGSIYVDANAISPASSRLVEATVRPARFVDGGIIGPPPTSAGTTRLYLSGPDAVEVSARLATVELEVHVVSEQIGAASAVKLAYAAWTKGTAALLLAIRAAARAEDVEAALLEEWRTSQPALAERSLTAARSGQAKGWRWVAEMQEIAAMFESVGLPGGFHHAAAEIFGHLPWQP